MLTIDTDARLARALDQPLAAAVHHLLALRRDQLGSIEGAAAFHLVEVGDTLTDVEAALGFPIATDLVEGTSYTDPDFVPSWESAELHSGGVYEIVYVLTDDGYAHVLLVPDRDDTDRALRSLLRDYVDQAEGAVPAP
ncbi:hypothetical protein [Sphingomonas sp. Mn802worker]|uniref:hypothetical protein n=1 Tax=Sphingomonas sp. Mn802worker TaxID=629773 RepID=UPI00035E5C65|nr:hypothetical protein [Sphingomonas sp. Mn802worker]